VAIIGALTLARKRAATPEALRRPPLPGKYIRDEDAGTRKPATIAPWQSSFLRQGVEDPARSVVPPWGKLLTPAGRRNKSCRARDAAFRQSEDGEGV
jgi:hypothetical protein